MQTPNNADRERRTRDAKGGPCIRPTPHRLAERTRVDGVRENDWRVDATCSKILRDGFRDRSEPSLVAPVQPSTQSARETPEHAELVRNGNVRRNPETPDYPVANPVGPVAMRNEQRRWFSAKQARQFPGGRIVDIRRRPGPTARLEEHRAHPESQQSKCLGMPRTHVKERCPIARTELQRVRHPSRPSW